MKTAYVVIARIDTQKGTAVAAGDLRVRATFRELDRRVGKRACDRCFGFPAKRPIYLESAWRFDTRKAADAAVAEARSAGARYARVTVADAPAKRRRSAR